MTAMNWWTEIIHDWDYEQLTKETAIQKYTTDVTAETELATTMATLDAQERMNSDNLEVRRLEAELQLQQAQLASADNMAALKVQQEKNLLDHEARLAENKTQEITANATWLKAKSLCLDKLGDIFGKMAKWDDQVGTIAGYYGQESQKTNLSDFMLEFSEKFGTAFEELASDSTTTA